MPPIYLDNHATTRVDPRVVAAMLPYFDELYGNAGSTTHTFGHAARDALQPARQSIAAWIGAQPNELIFTSGATESNNLAIFGAARHRRRRGQHLVSVTTEHKAVLDPLAALARQGYEVTLLPVEQSGSPRAGWLDPQRVLEALRDETCLVSVMLANNEIGTINDIAGIAAICQQRGVPLHCDATQAVGKLPVDVAALGIDLLSFTAHKIYGPKGVGAIYVSRRRGSPRLDPLIYGGGQEQGWRSGTYNVPGIVGFAKALELCLEELPSESVRLRKLRDRLFAGLLLRLPKTQLNGPILTEAGWRLPGNLNVTFGGVSGESLILEMRDLAVSSGSACTSANPEPSHVLRALGMDEDSVRAAIRFGLGRFNTEAEIEFAIESVAEAVGRLSQLGG